MGGENGVDKIDIIIRMGEDLGEVEGGKKEGIEGDQDQSGGVGKIMLVGNWY